MTITIFLLGFFASVCALQTGDVVEVKHSKSFKPVAKNSMYANSYCQKPSMVCPKGRILGSKKLVPTISECVARCNRHQGCITFHMDENEKGVKTCTLKDERCAKHELVPGQGTDFYRLKKGESCPSDRPLFVRPPIMYSDRYCAMLHKQCRGHNMYNRPQNIHVFTSVSEPYMACLHKCSGIRTCASVDFVGYKCVINDYHCPDKELDPAGRMDINFMRLPLGVHTCPANRQPPGSEESRKIFPAGKSSPPTKPDSGPSPPGKPDSGPSSPGKPDSGPSPPGKPDSGPSPPGKPDSGPSPPGKPDSGPSPPGKPDSTNEKPDCLCPCNSVRNDEGECKCKEGFENVNEECILACPVGAARQRDGSCRCLPGTDSIGRECLPKCPAQTRRDGRGCISR